MSSSSFLHPLALLCVAFVLSGCGSAPKSQEPESDGSVSHIVGGWVSDTFTGKRNALLVRPDGKAEYTYSEGKRTAADDEVDVDDAVFDEGGTVVWAVDLVYKGKNTWAAVNAVQIRGPKPLPYPYDPESEWTFDHQWRLEGGNLYDTKSRNRYMSLSQWGQLSGRPAQ